MTDIHLLKEQVRESFSLKSSEDIKLCNLDFTDYHKLLDVTMQEWNDDIHENLFIFTKVS